MIRSEKFHSYNTISLKGTILSISSILLSSYFPPKTRSENHIASTKENKTINKQTSGCLSSMIYSFMYSKRNALLVEKKEDFHFAFFSCIPNRIHFPAYLNHEIGDSLGVIEGLKRRNGALSFAITSLWEKPRISSICSLLVWTEISFRSQLTKTLGVLISPLANAFGRLNVT